MKILIATAISLVFHSAVFAQSAGSPFGSQNADNPGYKLKRTTNSDFDLAKVGGPGRVETVEMAEKIWKDFKSTHDFDGVSAFASADSGNCPESKLARHAFGHYVKTSTPSITLVDLQNCPIHKCKKGTVETVVNGFATTLPCETCAGTGKLGNVYIFKMLYSAEIQPLPGAPKDMPVAAKLAVSPLAVFCAENSFVPMQRPMVNGSEVILGKVDMEYSSSGVVLVMKIIDTSSASGGSGYYANIRLIDSDVVMIAELSAVYLPVGGGIMKIPLAKFSPTRGKVVGSSQEAQLAVLRNVAGIRVEADKYVSSGGLITTATSALRPKALK